MVNNAVDAILERSTDGDVWVRTGTNADRIFIEITDSGPGVQDSSRVFDPFYTTKPVGKGTGLGLSICYGIITEHGGTIRVRNVPTRGASFTIELPFQPVAALDSSASGQKTASGGDGRILLVDHDDSVREAVCTILRGRRHRVQTARDIREAHALLEKHDFDVVVADVQVSEGSNGNSLEAWLAKHKPALSSKLIWMCAVAPSNAVGEKHAASKSQILQKPFKANELLAAVDELLLGKADPAPIGR
jgi:two-component system NtrC family sensor kinase